jgi:glycosyltransferase involved in cell wall biosynthesis
VFTIHDLTRLRFPKLSYSDASFVDRFGQAEHDVMRAELAALSHVDLPTDTRDVFTRYFWALNRDLAQRAERLATVCEATAHDIRTLLHAPAHGVALVPSAVDPGVFHRRDEATITAVRSRFRLTGPYLVFVGLAHPSKRYPWLVEQLVRARNELSHGARLVVVGGHAEQVPGMSAFLTRHGAEDFVVHAGRLSDDDLAAAYSGAAALITASVNEGSNLPPMEALACGTQVIATDIPPLRENLGACAHFYAPNSGVDMVALAVRGLSGSLTDRSKSFRPLSWQGSGRRLFDVLSEVTARHRNGAARYCPTPAVELTVSPTRPMRSPSTDDPSWPRNRSCAR